MAVRHRLPSRLVCGNKIPAPAIGNRHQPLISSIERAVRRHHILRQTCLLPALFILGATCARAGTCPTAKDEIATDRPDVTNSSIVVPVGSLQNENGANFSMRDEGRIIDGTNSRW